MKKKNIGKANRIINLISIFKGNETVLEMNSEKRYRLTPTLVICELLSLLSADLDENTCGTVMNKLVFLITNYSLRH